MNHLQQLTRQLAVRIFILVLAANIILIGAWWFTEQFLFGNKSLTLLVLGTIAIALSGILASLISHSANEPLKLLSQAILHVAPAAASTPPPALEQIKFGRELVTSLALQVYQLASSSKSVPALTIAGNDHPTNSSLAELAIGNLPLPLIGLDKESRIVLINPAAKKYLQISDQEIIGRNVYEIVDLSFDNENTLEAWLQTCRTNKVTANSQWQRVKANLLLDPNRSNRQFDLAASYSKDNPANLETLLCIFDQTQRYAEDDQAISFISLAVHELRTPLTVLRGYIEVFQEELTDKLDPEQADFMHKMQAAAESLTGFVNNILNVARVEENQLILQLDQENWKEVLSSAIQNLELRARLNNISLELTIEENLPPVAVDRISIHEVINNLVDNAIKYSSARPDAPKKILINSQLNKEGLVETTVQDFGVGIAAALVPKLFEKFYRSHRTQAQVGGTGLGLYLCKAIVSAHSGNVWVRSEEGKGSIFGFTVVPYSKLAAELKESNNKEITRQAHGWIKNHSLYRR